MFAGLLAAVFLLFGITAVTNGGVDARQFPEAAVNYVERHGLLSSPHHMVEQDVIGCYLILRYGDKARVFIDDRVDMYPVTVSDDYTDLLYGRPTARHILDRYRIDTVLWDKQLPLVTILETSGGWHRVFEAKGWVVLVRGARPVSPAPAA